MDEPLSNLDAKLRLEMRSELQRLHLETGSTFVYVTHDQMEAMTLATKICLIENGVLQQYEAPLTVYSQPANTFVADFVGNPAINFIEAKGTQKADGSIGLSLLNGVQAAFTPDGPLSLTQWYADAEAAEAARKAAEAEKSAKKGHIEKGNKDSLFRYHVAMVEGGRSHCGRGLFRNAHRYGDDRQDPRGRVPAHRRRLWWRVVPDRAKGDGGLPGERRDPFQPQKRKANRPGPVDCSVTGPALVLRWHTFSRGSACSFVQYAL